MELFDLLNFSSLLFQSGFYSVFSLLNSVMTFLLHPAILWFLLEFVQGLFLFSFRMLAIIPLNSASEISFNSLSLAAIIMGLVLFGEVVLPWSFLFFVFLFWGLNITILTLLLEELLMFRRD